MLRQPFASGYNAHPGMQPGEIQPATLTPEMIKAARLRTFRIVGSGALIAASLLSPRLKEPVHATSERPYEVLVTAAVPLDMSVVPPEINQAIVDPRNIESVLHDPRDMTIAALPDYLENATKEEIALYDQERILAHRLNTLDSKRPRDQDKYPIYDIPKEQQLALTHDVETYLKGLDDTKKAVAHDVTSIETLFLLMRAGSYTQENSQLNAMLGNLILHNSANFDPAFLGLIQDAYLHSQETGQSLMNSYIRYANLAQSKIRA